MEQKKVVKKLAKWLESRDNSPFKHVEAKIKVINFKTMSPFGDGMNNFYFTIIFVNNSNMRCMMSFFVFSASFLAISLFFVEPDKVLDLLEWHK